MVDQVQTVASARDDHDLYLVRAIGRGDEQALRDLYARHGPALLSYLIGRLGQRLLAEEVLQDVMLAVWEGACRFRGDCRVRTWLLTIARYRAINKYRERKIETVPLEEMSVEPDALSVDGLVHCGEWMDMRAALGHLPQEQREVLELIFYHGLSGREAAKVLRIAPGTVKSRLYRARTALRELLEPSEDEDA